MKKTSQMQKMHSLFSPKAWRNGALLLLLLCFMGMSEVSAQASLNQEQEYVTSNEALKLLAQKQNEFETTVKPSLLTDAEYAEWKFYSYVAAFLQNGQSVETALENANTKVSQKATQLGTFTQGDVTEIRAEVEEFLRDN